MPSNPSGPIRRAQLIAPFGVGALINVPGGISVLVTGLDFWFDEKNDGFNYDIEEFKCEEWRLQELLHVNHFRLPPDYREAHNGQKIPNLRLTIPTFRFPTWYFCPDKDCRLLTHFPEFIKGRIKCPECENKHKMRIMYQVPFVTMCEQGHMQDFPWREWVHHSAYPTCTGRLKLVSTGSASLAGQKVLCKCGKERSLTGITTAGANNRSTYLSDHLMEGDIFLCQGYKPWLGLDVKENCIAPLRGSLRSASNLYFANMVSSLYLPRFEDQSLQKLEDLLNSAQLRLFIRTAITFDQDVNTIAEKIQAKYSTLLMGYTVEQLSRCIQKIVFNSPKESQNESNIQLEEELNGEERQIAFRYAEFNALLKDRDDKDLKIKKMDMETYEQDVIQLFKGINLVKKLRETKVLASFSRILPEPQLDHIQRQLILWKNPPSYEESWLPAYIVYGEGIFFEFDESKLAIWENRNDVKSRLGVVVKNYQLIQSQRGLTDRTISPRFVLLHTFAHIVMNRLTFECGYSSAALRERLYISTIPEKSMASVLIYTADGDSEGTMGGLVRMGKPGNIEPVIRRAIEHARWCSADPVCIEMGRLHGQGPDSCNLAACHNCALVPETACEEYNRFLDRGLVIGEITNPDLGFFANI